MDCGEKHGTNDSTSTEIPRWSDTIFSPKGFEEEEKKISFTKIESERESGAGTNVAVSSESIGELRSVRELSALLVLYSLPPLPLVLSGASAQPLHPRSYY